MSMALRTLAFAAALSVTGSAQAGLFADDEARKAILDLRAKVTALEEANKKLASAQEVQDQVTALRRSLADLANQNEALRAEVAKLRGTNEQLARDFADTQRRLADQLQSFDGRLKPLEPMKVSLDGKDFQAAPEERNQYEAAMGLLRRGEFADASAAYQSFLKRFPASGYSDAIRFSLGNALYGQRQYREAVAAFRAFLASSPTHPRASEAALALAACQIEMKDVKGGRRSLEDVIKTYPGTEAAQVAKERLASLK